jgi:hypothetical protein
VVAGRDADLIAADPVHEAMLVGDPPGPVIRQVVSERSGLADSRVAVAIDVGQQRVDSPQSLAVSRSDSYRSSETMATGSWPARVMTTSSRSLTTPFGTSAWRARDSVWLIVFTTIASRTESCTCDGPRAQRWPPVAHVMMCAALHVQRHFG